MPFQFIGGPDDGEWAEFEDKTDADPGDYTTTLTFVHDVIRLHYYSLIKDKDGNTVAWHEGCEVLSE